MKMSDSEVRHLLLKAYKLHNDELKKKLLQVEVDKILLSFQSELDYVSDNKLPEQPCYERANKAITELIEQVQTA